MKRLLRTETLLKTMNPFLKLNVLFLFFTGLAGEVSGQTYCTVTATNDCSASLFNPTISNFSLLTINNNSGCSTGSYADYSSTTTFPTLEATLVAGNSYPFSITRQHGDFASAYAVNIWIDLDGNFTFDANERVGYIAQTPNCTGFPYCNTMAAQTGNLVIPAGVSAGTKRMRVRLVYNGDSGNENNPCGNIGYGETEDYRVIFGGTTASITTSTINPLTYCSGTTATIPFTVSGTFNAGNVFTAQLSDSTGNFADPVSIGTLSGTASGSVLATIPTGTIAASGYRIRIVSSNPVITGSANSSDIIVNKAPQVTISSSNLTVCAGGTTSISGTTNSGPIVWEQSTNGINYVPATGASGLSFTSAPISQDTWFRLSATNACGTTRSDSIKITISAAGQINIVQSPATSSNLCNGPITLTVPNSVSNVTWSNSQTGNSIVITTPGTYSGTGTGTGGCITNTNSVVLIETTPTPMTTTPSGTVTSCADSVILTAAGGFASYSWSITNDTIQATEVRLNGSYTVTGTDANGCITSSAAVSVTLGSGQTGTLAVTPAGPLTFCTGETVILTAEAGFENYIWSDSRTGASIIISTPGTYSVSAESTAGCSSQSGNVVVSEIGVPVASFTATQTTGYTVQFTNTTPDGASFLWDLGAGVTVTQESPSFTFPFDGFYDVTLVVTNSCGTDSVTISVEVKKLVGIEDISGLSNLQLLPNPTSGIVNISGDTKSGDSYKLSVLNAIGQEIVNESFDVNGTWMRTFDFSIEANGVYWLVLKNATGTTVKKLVVL